MVHLVGLWPSGTAYFALPSNSELLDAEFVDITNAIWTFGSGGADMSGTGAGIPNLR